MDGPHPVGEPVTGAGTIGANPIGTTSKRSGGDWHAARTGRHPAS